MTEKKPKISIITVCYNSAEHIEECIQSIVTQEYENLEYIIIDGGSTDGTLDIISKYRDKIAYFVSEPDKGISDAFNKGIKAATGDIIGIINSDDKLVEHALSLLAEAYEDKVDVYRGICKMWNDGTGYVYDEHPTMEWPLVPFKMRVAHPSTFVTKRAYNKWGGFRIECKYSMDFDLLVRLYKNKALFKYIDKPLAYFRLGGVSQSSESKRLKELKAILAHNGAKKLQVFVFDVYYRLRLLVKHIVTLFGEDFRFKLINKY